MLPSLLAAWYTHQMWFAVPLVVAISLVYGATRDEAMVPILRYALHTGLWILGFMAVIFVVLFVISWSL